MQMLFISIAIVSGYLVAAIVGYVEDKQ